MKRRFIFIYNPISGTKQKDKIIQYLQKEMGKLQWSYAFQESNAASEYDFLIERIIADSITDVIIIGGDGTVNQIAGALQGIDVKFGIIPMGSGNGLALAAGISKNHKKALQIIVGGNSKIIDAFWVNQKFSCMLCGIGLDAKVAHDFAKSKTRGLWTYVKISIRNFLKAPDYNFSLQLNDTTIHTKAYFISVANSNQFGNHVTIAPAASLDDGLLDIVIVNKMNKLKLIGYFAYQLLFGKVDEHTHKHRGKQMIQYFQSDKILIKNPENAPMHIDGDPESTMSQLSIQIIPKAFSLLVP